MNTPSQQVSSYTIPGSQYGYTGMAIDTLASFENTIAQGLLDESGSTNSFAKQMEDAVKFIIRSLRNSPRADNLIYRQCHFATNYREHHGFLPLSQINESMYDGCYIPGGITTLYDSTDRMLKEVKDYGKKQAEQKYSCNGICYMLTDGRDYGSVYGQNDVKSTLMNVNSDESLESLITILIGVNEDSGIQRDLEAYAKFVGFTQYIPLGKADVKTLNKLGNFLSQSISSQSQALGTGGPSQSLTF